MFWLSLKFTHLSLRWKQESGFRLGSVADMGSVYWVTFWRWNRFKLIFECTLDVIFLFIRSSGIIFLCVSSVMNEPNVLFFYYCVIHLRWTHSSNTLLCFSPQMKFCFFYDNVKSERGFIQTSQRNVLGVNFWALTLQMMILTHLKKKQLLHV